MSPPTPHHACVILRTPDHRFLLEIRPSDARHAAGQWTCFGGQLEPGESALACARRELLEELGWSPPAFAPGVDLFVRGAWVAHFFIAAFDQPLSALRLEPGRQATLLDASALADAPLSSWHRAALRAHLAGQDRVDL